MKILLVDIDSKIPNLALMKISAYHKSMGDEVGFYISNPDKVYSSIIYPKNIHKLDGVKTWFNVNEIGGSGFLLEKKLPDHIENMCPDYNLYPNMDYSMGFTSRGCDRNCYFCLVNKKEGNWQKWHDPELFVRHDKVKLLDNNLSWNREHYFKIMNWMEEHDNILDITQGLDIRCMDRAMLEQLKYNKFWKPIHFAYDHIALRNIIKEKINIMKSLEMEKILRNKCYFFVYCNDDSQYEETLIRCNDLKSWGTNAFVMYNIDNKKTRRIKDLQRWANKPWLFWKCDFEDYKKSD